ncbi:MAG: MarR family protein [Euryarchaeota archaeon ADurb.Bin294]|nr:MAG: MarR family protein [Euryarchaeota archaeon ADurb.Bin294]
MTPGESFILYILSQHQELTADEIAGITNMKKGTVEHNLRQLATKGEVERIYRISNSRRVKTHYRGAI